MRYCIPFISLLGLVMACSGNSTNTTSNASGSGSSNAGAGGSDSSSASSGGSGASTTGAGGAGTGGAPMACGTFQSGDDFLACAATYLTGDGADMAGGVAIAPNGDIFYAGSIAAGDFGVTSTTLLDGGTAGLIRFSSDGRKVLSVTRLGSAVTDVAIRKSNGQIAVSGSFGAAVLDSTGKTVLWSSSAPGNASEIAIGEAGTVATLVGTKVTVFDKDGAILSSFDVPTNREVTDVAIDDGSKLVFATGFKQDDGAPCTQLQIPFLRAYAFNGTLAWKAYDWNKTEAGNASECADSRGYALAMGADGKLYYAGESHGGNTVHRRLPLDLTQNAPVVKYDAYNDPYNLNGAAPIGFYARFDPATGTIEQAQFVCTRLSSGKGNAARPRAIAADAQGNMFIAGATACCIENGPTKTVNGSPAMPAYAGGGFLLVVSSDFKQRLAWTAFNGEIGGGANGTSVAVGASSAALLFQQNIDPAKQTSTTEIPLLTFNAVQSLPGGGASDGHLVVFPAP